MFRTCSTCSTSSILNKSTENDRTRTGRVAWKKTIEFKMSTKCVRRKWTGDRITHTKLWTGNEKLLLSFCAPPPPHICNLIGQILSGGLPVLVPIFHPGKIQWSGNRYSPFLTLINNSMVSWTNIMFCMYKRICMYYYEFATASNVQVQTKSKWRALFVFKKAFSQDFVLSNIL